MPTYRVEFRDIETDVIQHSFDTDDLNQAALLLAPTQYLRVITI